MNTAEQPLGTFARIAGAGPDSDGLANIDGFLRGTTTKLSQLEADLVYSVGASFYEREEYHTAIDFFRLLVLARPEEVRSWTSLAMVHDALGDLEHAASLYQLAVAAPIGDEWRDRARLYGARSSWGTADFDTASDLITEVERVTLSPELTSLYDELRHELARSQR